MRSRLRRLRQEVVDELCAQRQKLQEENQQLQRENQQLQQICNSLHPYTAWLCARLDDFQMRLQSAHLEIQNLYATQMLLRNRPPQQRFFRDIGTQYSERDFRELDPRRTMPRRGGKL